MKKPLSIAAMVIAATLVIGYLIWRSQPEQVLKRQCKTLIGMADDVGNGVGIFDINRLEKMLADQVTFQIDVVAEEAFSARKMEVVGAYRWLGGSVQKSSFKITEFKSIKIEGDEAWISTRVDGLLEMPDMRMIEGEHKVGFTWMKGEDGSWVLSEFVFVQ